LVGIIGASSTIGFLTAESLTIITLYGIKNARKIRAGKDTKGYRKVHTTQWNTTNQTLLCRLHFIGLHVYVLCILLSFLWALLPETNSVK